MQQKQEKFLRACYFCVNNIKEVDYQDTESLKKFVSSYMKIAPKKRSGLCSKHQRKTANAIKNARIAGLMPYVSH